MGKTLCFTLICAYLYVMSKDRIIELLQEQNRHLQMQLERMAEREIELGRVISNLSQQVGELTATIKSMEAALALKEGTVGKLKRVNNGISKLLANESEKQVSNVVKSAVPTPKERGNNGARRKNHVDLEEQIIEIEPTHPLFNKEEAKFVSYRDAIRYVYIPPKFIKYIYRQKSYSYNGAMFCGTAPEAPFLNSQYDGSFVAGLCQLRYIYSMSMERIVRFFGENGFGLEKSTAFHLLERSASLFENLYKALQIAVLEDHYCSCDETYHKVLVDEKNTKGKGVKKGYFWAVTAMHRKLIFYLYDQGSRKEEIIMNLLDRYKGAIQSDAYLPYIKLGSSQYPNITRIACLQHIKRKFLDLKEDPDARKIVDLTNKLYHEEHQHRIGEQG